MQWKLDALQEQCLKPRAREALAAGDRLTGPEERKVQQRARSGVEGQEWKVLFRLRGS